MQSIIDLIEEEMKATIKLFTIIQLKILQRKQVCKDRIDLYVSGMYYQFLVCCLEIF